MEDIKKLLDLLIAQVEDMTREKKNIRDFLEGEKTAFKLIKDYIERTSN